MGASSMMESMPRIPKSFAFVTYAFTGDTCKFLPPGLFRQRQIKRSGESKARNEEGLKSTREGEAVDEETG